MHLNQAKRDHFRIGIARILRQKIGQLPPHADEISVSLLRNAAQCSL